MPIDVGPIRDDFPSRPRTRRSGSSPPTRARTSSSSLPLDWSPTCEKENCKVSGTPRSRSARTRSSSASAATRPGPTRLEAVEGIKHDLSPTRCSRSRASSASSTRPSLHQPPRDGVVDKTGKVAFVQVQENTKEERNWGELQAAMKKLG